MELKSGLKQWMVVGRVQGKHLSVDGSFVEANAAKESRRQQDCRKHGGEHLRRHIRIQRTHAFPKKRSSPHACASARSLTRVQLV
jgi:hypothetical protein